jgi:hypothetical protein
MLINHAESLFEEIWRAIVEELEVSYEVAANIAKTIVSRVTGFFFRFDDVPDSLHLKDVLFDGTRFTAIWESISTEADCPTCGKTSTKPQSRHLRKQKVQDVGICNRPLWHQLWRKKYRCTNEHCVQTNFLEGFPGFIEMRRSRMTVKFAEHVLGSAVNTSSRSAAKILQSQGAETSRDTVIRVALRRGAKEIEKNFYENASDVVNIGIDDINLRKGDNSTSCMVLVPHQARNQSDKHQT